MAKKFVATSFLATCLLTSSLTAGIATAKDPELYFYPKNKWTIEHVGENQSNALPTCAVSNQMNNGYIVQFAGTHEGFTNLNIDFRQGSFKKNMRYEVKYSVPGVVEKTIPTKAFRENLLVSDLRNDREFADALRTASVLDVQIRGTEFRMYMTGLEAAMKDYTHCIKPGQQEIATAAEEPEAEEVPVENMNYGAGDKDSDIVAHTIPRQPAPVEDASAPPPPLDISTYTSDTPAELATIPKHKPLNRQAVEERPRYTERLAKKLEEESRKYRAQEDVNQEMPPPPPAEALENVEVIEPKEIKKTVATEPAATIHKTVPQDPPPATPPLAEPEKQVKAQPEVIDFTQQTQRSERVANTQTPTEIRDASEVLASIEPASGTPGIIDATAVTPIDRGEEFINMRNQIAELEQKVGALRSENTILDEELKAALKDAEHERMSVSSDNWNLERATMKFNEAERQMQRLGRQLQTYRAQCEQEKTELETMLFDPKLTNQQQLTSLAALETELDTAKSDLYRQQRQYEERIRILEEQLNNAQ